MIVRRGWWRWLVLALAVAFAVVWLMASADRPVASASLTSLGAGVEALQAGPVTAVGTLRAAPGPKVGPVAMSIAARPQRASGGASWYCKPGRSACTIGHSGGLFAAAGPKLRALLGPRYMGRSVVVGWRGHTVRVVVIDWCGCPDGRVLDLYADAFEALAGKGSLGRGVLDVVVTR